MLEYPGILHETLCDYFANANGNIFYLGRFINGVKSIRKDNKAKLWLIEKFSNILDITTSDSAKLALMLLMYEGGCFDPDMGEKHHFFRHNTR